MLSRKIILITLGVLLHLHVYSQHFAKKILMK